MRICSKIDVNRYKCWDCGTIVNSWIDFRKHRREFHVNKKEHKCTVCQKAFNKRTELVEHSRGHTGERPFACTVCDKRYPREASLKFHYQTQHAEKSFLCKDCGKALASSASLRLHARIHSGVKPYKCPFCEKEFARRDMLNSHMRVHRSEKHNGRIEINKCLSDSVVDPGCFFAFLPFKEQ